MKDMELRYCKIGMIVREVIKNLYNDHEEIGRTGHIIGLGINSMNDIILKVEWAERVITDHDVAHESVSFIHPSNVREY